MKNLLLCSTVALVAVGTSQRAQSASLAINDSVSVTANGLVAGAANTGAPTNAAAFSYSARERQNPGQVAIRVVTFIDFDTSALTAPEVNAPGFQATFTIDHVGHLNTLNTGFDLSFGRNVSGTWNSGGSLPFFSWAAASADQAVLLADVHTVPNAQALTLDVTPIVQGWVNGTFVNEGIVLLGTPGGGNFSQASFLDNAAINTSTIPEPSSFALAGLGLLGLLARRRR